MATLHARLSVEFLSQTTVLPSLVGDHLEENIRGHSLTVCIPPAQRLSPSVVQCIQQRSVLTSNPIVSTLCVRLRTRPRPYLRSDSLGKTRNSSGRRHCNPTASISIRSFARTNSKARAKLRHASSKSLSAEPIIDFLSLSQHQHQITRRAEQFLTSKNFTDELKQSLSFDFAPAHHFSAFLRAAQRLGVRLLAATAGHGLDRAGEKDHRETVSTM